MVYAQSRLLILFLFMLLPCFVTGAFAETILFKSGKTVDGKITERDMKSIKVDSQGVSLTYYYDKIYKMDSRLMLNGINDSTGLG